MLIKPASRQSLAKTFGPLGAIMVETWPHGTEIRHGEQVVLFFDETGHWMVGFKFRDIIMAAAMGTPEQFHREVRRWLQRSKAGQTLPRREGRVW